MSEAVTTPIDNGQTPVETPPEPETSGLPSEQPTGTEYDGFALTDDLKAKFKDGKLNGRFGSVEEVLTKLKEAEDFRANTIREQTNGQQQQQQEQTSAQTQNALVAELLPVFLENGLVLTPDMEAKLTDGITNDTEKQLAIYKFRDEARGVSDRANKAYTVVGGKENYAAMQEWGAENLTEEQKKAFTGDVNGSVGASIIAVEWLNNKYQEALKSGTVTQRIQGQPHSTGVRPYSDRRELYKDKDYVESVAGRRDTAAQKMFKARKNITPDSVIFGR